MNKLHIHEHICTSCSERVSKCVCWCSQHLSNVHTCTCVVLTTPVEMHTTLSAKNTYALVHARICNCAEASLPWKRLRTYLESCTSIVQAVVCRPLLPPVLLSRPNPSPDAVCSRNPSKSMLAHDAVGATLLHKHHSFFFLLLFWVEPFLLLLSALLSRTLNLVISDPRDCYGPHCPYSSELTPPRNREIELYLKRYEPSCGGRSYG